MEFMTSPEEFRVAAWPRGGWVIGDDDYSISMVFDSRTPVETHARRLATRFGVARARRGHTHPHTH